MVHKMAGASSSWYLYIPVCPQMPTCCACLYNRWELTVSVYKADEKSHEHAEQDTESELIHFSGRQNRLVWYSLLTVSSWPRLWQSEFVPAESTTQKCNLSAWDLTGINAFIFCSFCVHFFVHFLFPSPYLKCITIHTAQAFLS